LAASLQATALLAADPLFTGRVQAAMVTAAINVASEAIGSQDVATYQARHDLAVAILQGTRPSSAWGAPPGTVPWLSQFVWATAANVTIAGDIGAPVPVASSTDANPSVITTATAHGLETGGWAEVSGHEVNTAVNGVWAVTVIDATSFSVPVPGSGVGAATGQVTAQPPDGDIQFSVNAAFSSIAGVGTVT
jgi:hypothetical protein